MSNLLSSLEEKWTPWAQLKTMAPHKEIWEEFNSVIDLCVVHRADYSEGWKSLTLHGLKPEWTEAAERYSGCEKYTDTTAPNQWTPIAERCPKTRQYLESLPFTQFHRVRFMLLAPGGFIRPHKDTHKSSLRALNIAIHHPNGCHFDFFENEDHHKIRCTVPFTSGTAFFVNIGLYHQFRNESNDWRLHIIVHGKTSNDFNNNTPAYFENYYS